MAQMEVGSEMTMIKAEEERSEIHYPAEEKRVVKQIADKIVYTPHTIVQCKDVEVRDYQQTERIVEDIIEVPRTIIQEEIIPQFVEYVVDVEKRVNVPVLQKRLIPRAVKQIEEEVVVRPQTEYHHDIVERTIRDIRKKPVYVDTVVQQHVVLLREVEEIVEDVIEVPCVEYVDDIVYRIAPQRPVTQVTQPAPGNPSSMAFYGQSLTGGYTQEMGGYTQQQTVGYTHQPQTRGYVLQQTGGYAQQQTRTRGYVLQQTGGYAQETGGYTPQLQTRGYVLQQTGGYAQQQPQTGGYTQQQTRDYSQQPQTDGYAQQSTGGYSEQSTGGYTQQQTSDYSQQPQTGGYAQQQTGGYSQQQTSDYSQQPKTDGYAQQQTGGYSQQSTGGYSQQSTGGYTQQQTGGYSQQPQADGYAQQQTGGYSQQSTGANSQQPQTDGYAQQQAGGYSPQSTGGYTQQPQTDGYAQQQTGGYSQQPQTDGYAQQQTGGYSQQPQTDGYAQQQTGANSQQSTGANSQQPQTNGYAQQQTGGYTQQQTGGYTQQQTSDYKPKQMGIRTEREERTVRFLPGATPAVNPSPKDPAKSHLQPPHTPPFRVTSPPMETVSQLAPRLTLRQRQSLQRPLLFLTPPRRSRHEGPDSRPTQHGVLQPPPPLRIPESIQPLQQAGRKSYAGQSPDARRRTTYGEEAWDWYDNGQSSEGPWCGLPLGMKPPAKPPATAQHSAGRWRKSDVADTHWETAVGWWASLFAGNIGQSAEEKREIVRQVRKSIIEPVASVPPTNWTINSAQRGVSDNSNSFPRTETQDMRGPGPRNLNLSVANSGYMDSQLSHAQSAARGNQHSQPKPGQQFTPEEQLQLQYLDALEQQLDRDCVSNGAQQLQEYPRSQTPPIQYSGMRQPSMQRYPNPNALVPRAPHATQPNMVTQPGITPLDHSVRGNP